MHKAALALVRAGLTVVPWHRMVPAANGGAECSCMKGKRWSAEQDGRDPPICCDNPAKHPMGRWTELATNDENRVQKLWTGTKYSRANIAVVTGSASGVFVVDVDAPEGLGSLEALEAKHGPLPPTPTAKSGGCGLHFYFKHPTGPDIPNSASYLAPKIDTRGENGLIVASPSNHASGNRYEWVEGKSITDLPLAALPDWIIAKLAERQAFGGGAAARKQRAFLEVQSDHISVRPSGLGQKAHSLGSKISAHLSQIGDGEGQSGFNAPIYRTFCAYFRKHGLEANPEPILDAVQAAVTTAARKAGRGRTTKYDSVDYLTEQAEKARVFVHEARIVSLSPACSQGSSTRFENAEQAVASINEVAALVRFGGKVRVIVESGSQAPDFLSLYEAGSWFERYRYLDETRSDGTKIWKPAFPLWMQHENQRRFEGVTFAPGGGANGRYNLWTGYQIAPNPYASWNALQRHLLLSLCDGNPYHFIWLISWLSQTLQEPEKKMGTALVVKGAKGAGKTTVTVPLSRILGKHLVTVSDNESLFGKFNAHLSQALVIVSEEAVWAGSHAVDGSLKHKITAATMQLEKKGVDRVEIPDHSRLILISNEDRIVPATPDERRFFCLEMRGYHQSDKDYFDRLYSELESDGPSGMLADLLKFDFNQVNLRKPPVTPLLLEQIANHLTAEDRWFWSVLSEGEFYDTQGEPSGQTDDWFAGELQIDRRTVFNSFSAKVRSYGGGRSTEIAVGRYLKKLIPDLKIARPHSKSGERPRCFVLPPLRDLRASFSAYCGVDFEQTPNEAGYEGEVGCRSSSEDWGLLDVVPESDDVFYLAAREMQIEGTLGMIFEGT